MEMAEIVWNSLDCEILWGWTFGEPQTEESDILFRVFVKGRFVIHTPGHK